MSISLPTLPTSLWRWSSTCNNSTSSLFFIMTFHFHVSIVQFIANHYFIRFCVVLYYRLNNSIAFVGSCPSLSLIHIPYSIQKSESSSIQKILCRAISHQKFPATTEQKQPKKNNTTKALARASRKRNKFDHVLHQQPPSTTTTTLAKQFIGNNNTTNRHRHDTTATKSSFTQWQQ